LLGLLSGCLPEKFGQERLDQLCESYCATAVTTVETGFEPDTHASSTKYHCGQVRGNLTIPAGTVVYVAAVMPARFDGNTALVGFLNEAGTAQVGWVNVDDLGNWSPRMYGLIDHCS